MENHETPEAIKARAEQADPLVMYLIVREELEMSIGKACAQCAHASQMITLKYLPLYIKYFEKDIENSGWIDKSSYESYLSFVEWLAGSFRKVVLKSDEKEWVKIKNELPNNSIIVVDAGLTELQPNTETVIGLWPMKRSERPKIIKKLQVLT
jgi:PTH2 family peptidyl-tRNA hydrolase